MKKNRAIRQRERYIKGMRRLREDRAQHGDGACPCKEEDAGHGRGVIFARFADYPQTCSGSCCGNPRRHWNEVTRQELRAPTVRDWE